MIQKNNLDQKWPIIGDKRVVDFLKKSINNDKINGAYLFYGPKDIGKKTVARYFAQVLLCNDKKNQNVACGQCHSCIAFTSTEAAHNDFFEINILKDKKNISIEQIREFIFKISFTSLSSVFKVGLIVEVENLSQEAANAFLKILEEPSGKTVIILTTSNIGALPETIISRCQLLRFTPLKIENIYNYLTKERSLSKIMAKNIAKLSLGKMSLALKFIEDKEYFENYQKIIQSFFIISQAKINDKFKEVENILNKNSEKFSFLEIIDIWISLARDLLFILLEQKDMVRNQIKIIDLTTLSLSFDINKVMKILKDFEEIKKQVRVNVNPKIILENFAINRNF